MWTKRMPAWALNQICLPYNLRRLRCMRGKMHFPVCAHHLVNWLQCPSVSPCLQVNHKDALLECLHHLGVSDSCLYSWLHKLGSSPSQWQDSCKDSCSLSQSLHLWKEQSIHLAMFCMTPPPLKCFPTHFTRLAETLARTLKNSNYVFRHFDNPWLSSSVKNWHLQVGCRNVWIAVFQCSGKCFLQTSEMSLPSHSGLYRFLTCTICNSYNMDTT